MDSGPFAIVTSSPPDPVCPSRAILDNRRRAVLLNRADVFVRLSLAAAEFSFSLPRARPGRRSAGEGSPCRILAYDFQGAMTVHSLSLTAGSTRGA